MRFEFDARARLYGVLALAVVIVALVAAYFLTGGSEEEAPAEPTGTVTTAVAAQGSLSPTAIAYGTVVSSPAHTRIIVMPHEGTIESVDVHDGDAVRSGQAIVTIAIAPAAAAQYAQARSALDFAQQDLARVERLFAEKLATNDQLGTARKALSDAQAQLDQLNKTGADRAQDTLRAPFDGVVTALSVNPGDRPQVGAALATLASQSDVIVQLGLEPEDAARLKPGAPVELIPPQDGVDKISGKLASVGSAIDGTSHLVKAVADIPAAESARATLGQTLVAHVALPARQGIVIPRGALLEDADGPYVFTVVNGKAHRQAIQIAVETDEQALIDKGLAAGARVIVTGNGALEDGVAVQEAKP